MKNLKKIVTEINKTLEKKTRFDIAVVAQLLTFEENEEKFLLNLDPNINNKIPYFFSNSR